MKNLEKYTDSDWEKLAAKFSGENPSLSDELGQFSSDDELHTEKYWNEMRGTDKEINVDKAWNKLNARISESGLEARTIPITRERRLRFIASMAATVLVILGIGSAILYLNNSGYFNKNMVITSSGNQRNVEVTLPDGSKVWLNRNSQLAYSRDLGKTQRDVKLKGEAFFEITPDPSKPFIIDAGQANVKVVGTSFNVITNNPKDEVEVFVKTGKVLVSDNEGQRKLFLEPGDLGKVNSAIAEKTGNLNPNYLSWKTDILVYDGQKLDVVFSDLKKVFDIDVVSDDTAVLGKTITTVFDKQPQDTIIQIICTTFNFSYTKDGSVYHLSK